MKITSLVRSPKPSWFRRRRTRRSPFVAPRVRGCRLYLGINLVRHQRRSGGSNAGGQAAHLQLCQPSYGSFSDAAGSGAGGSSAVFRARADAAAGGRSRSGSDVMPPVSSWILQEQFELRPLLDRCSEDCIDCLRSSTESCIGWGAIIDPLSVVSCFVDKLPLIVECLGGKGN